MTLERVPRSGTISSIYQWSRSAPSILEISRTTGPFQKTAVGICSHFEFGA